MDLIDRVGVVIPASSTDPAGDARRLESLGFGHAVLPHDSLAPVLLALGATRRLRLLATADVIKQLSAGGALSQGDRTRLEALDPEDRPLTLNPADKTTAYAAIAARTGSGARVTVEFAGPHAPRVCTLALDILASSLPGRASRTLYAEDLTLGQRFDLGAYELTADEIISFAERFDPLDFHLDPQLAAASPIGVLCASGIHTQAIMQRLNARGFHRSVAVVAGRGMLGMRLPKPATPGLLRGATEIIGVRLRPTGRALVTIRSTLHSGDDLMLEQTGELVVQQRRAGLEPQP